ncbi:STAS/SEC14 domain-containing protein [Salarchaeum sp. JOR-1]|uniref:STAS/SEC14 domain-containing protein n=1 Tax=Salarchaeum sp. JOR-1 TaxID=2599399 RepID=UPI00119856CF|nr:STAS/SEC14 domain-containing protein [Salarchaeum sp. JOR-1]QDX41432.1 STAS/SEC14 domain-containing protein [Salarchaeum sp. JOR-1]
MHEKLDRSHGNVLGYEVRDELGEDDLAAILEDFEETIREEGSVRVLVEMPSVPTPQLDALDEDVGFWLEHGDDIEKYAVVGDSTLVEWATAAGDRVSSIDIRHFDAGDIDDAWAWVDA